ncbi:SpoIIE family protein phosphatase [Treponema pedis]|uniref:SpoIIE family protein phosphatase n=1 Tax=Treponema pedis TaxID=409322 RepID=A0A7S6WQH2_9SPIR|nr:SpoIIE family protein phosphatase [Treponema pedis]QOW61473.1 SpoIIE family protein phosphatase [Treponema pedis]
MIGYNKGLKFLFAFLFSLFFLSLNAQDFYWETPTVFSGKNGQFLKSASNKDISAVVWEEVVANTGTEGHIFISAAVYSDGNWNLNERISSPIPYTADIPSIVSVAVGNYGDIIVTYIKNRNTIGILKSEDEGKTFSEKEIVTEMYDLGSPYISVLSNGKYILFVSRGIGEKFSLFYSLSNNGIKWSEFTEFDREKKSDRVFLPVHTVAENNDVIVFQALDSVDNRQVYGLFSSYSSNGGSSWSAPVKITENNTSQNQRPEILYSHEERKIFAVWEQSLYRAEKTIVAFAALNTKGQLTSGIEKLPQQRSSVFNPKVIIYNKKPLLTWTEDYEKNGSLCIAVKKNSAWEISTVRKFTGSLLFVQPFVLEGNLQLIWQEGMASQRIMRIQPDFQIAKAKLQPVDFDARSKSGKKRLTVDIKFPYDSSGIAGYAYVWSKDTPPDFVEPVITKLKSESKLVYEPEVDGLWYLGVRICDYAGNWSEMSVVACERDSTPPMPPIFELLALDKNGFSNSNSFEIKWNPPEADITGKEETQIKGYIKSVQYVADIQKFKSLLRASDEVVIDDESVQNILKDKFKLQLNLSKLTTNLAKQRIENYENGLYAIAVSAVDASGNISEPAVKYFALNKYIPYTNISNIETQQLKDGTVLLSIIGKGFTTDGIVENVYIDSDGVPPYDLIFEKENTQGGNTVSSKNYFSIISDKVISDIRIDDLDSGEYYVGVRHSSRGIYFSKEKISVDNLGNIKFGDYGKKYRYNWLVSPDSETLFDYLIVFIIIIFILFILIFSVIGVIKSIKEAVELKKEVHALLNGGIMATEKRRKKAASLKAKGGGLRVKFILLTVVLVISVILILALPLGAIFLNTQETLLAESLFSKTEVLLESLSAGAKAYLPSKNLLELQFLSSQIATVEEAKFATITGTHLQNKKEGYNFIWASNDPDLADKIQNAEFSAGESELKLPEMESAYEEINRIDAEARERVGGLANEISSLTKEAVAIALNTDQKSIDRRNELQIIIRQMEEKLNLELSNLSVKGSGSYPKFNSKELSEDITEYLFYKPILYRQQGNTENFVHGMIYIQVSTKNTLAKINEVEKSLISMILYISLISLAVGILDAFILASIIIAPIKKLVAHIDMINSTEDKEQLADKSIKIKSKDEIGILGTTINNMTSGLAAAAAASKDLTVGKEIQKMFLPLDTDSLGRKLTCGKSSDDNVEFFGYYEGARGVSGDYFDYIKLDDRYYAIIKCDIAGKGVPAALIMVEVATLFLDYFKDWKFQTHGLKIDYLVSRINDLIESRGFKGRFAAFTLCIFDSVSGEVHFCNAGDNVINIYDASLRKMKEVVLTEVSAAGVFPSFMIDMKGGFKVETVKLNKGDVLFLYTDGIEEAKRLFRNSKLQPIVCAVDGLNVDDVHETHTVGQDGEELGKERVCKIIESIFDRTSFNLKKWHNPIEDEEFNFDFTSLEGSVEDVVIGLVSIEKIFRMYQDPKATELNMVKVDKKIDLFLNKHFRQYQAYCSNRRPNTDADEYIYYTNIREDEQYDDLTILGIRKK